MIELQRPNKTERRTIHLLATLSDVANRGWGVTLRLALLLAVTGSVGLGVAYIAFLLR